ncbi:MAG: two-component system response regulator [Thermodesulfobacteriota bacterium]
MIKDANILVVDDLTSSRYALVKLLEKQGFANVYEVENGKEALERLHKIPVDLVLLDFMMPEINGIDVLKIIKSDPLLAPIPVIMITVVDNTDETVRAIELGAEDYLPKPFNPVMLKARVKASLEKKRLRDIEKEYLRMYDLTTGLPNRRFFVDRLNEELQRSRSSHSLFAVFHIRLDTYDTIAESLDQKAAEDYILARAEQLSAILPANAEMARISDHVFAVLLFDLQSDANGNKTALRVYETLCRPMTLRGNDISSKIRVGVVYATGLYTEAEAMMRDASLAAGKVASSGGFKIFDDAMHKDALKRLRMEPELRRAMAENQFRLYYQPIVDLQSSAIVGYEALLRWLHPEKGMILPDEFIPLAEETRLIIPLGQWVVEEACRQAARWQKHNGGNNHRLPVSINISIHQLTDPDFIAHLQKGLAANATDGQNIHLEVTESGLIENPDQMETILNAVQQINVKTALDDFGKGYCSLSYLHRFPFDTLKIDKSFVHNLHRFPRNREIVNSTIDLAHRLGMAVVAEGIETGEEAGALREMNCEFGQGFLFNHPMPDNEAEKLTA